MISLATYLMSLVGITLLALLIACVGSMATMVLFDLFVTSPDPNEAKNVHTSWRN
jgi:hypothetical protein